MRYLIDGYNLLHAMGLLSPKKGVGNALENARFDLLDRLHTHFGDLSGQITVVFDAGRVPRRGEPVHDYRGLHVQFAVRQEADEWIETLIQNDATPKSLTIVSDDHRVQTAARRRQCPVLGCHAFLDVAEREPRPPPAKSGESDGKPDGIAPEERQRWLDAFADLDDDPALKKWLDPGSCEVDE
jgi:predicted RNA-binding protein with PIN domain